MTPHRKGSDGSRSPPPGGCRRPSLRADSGRREARDTFLERFDLAWEDLSKALEGISLPAVARAFGEP